MGEGGIMDTYESTLEATQKESVRMLNTLEDYRTLFPILHEYAELFSDLHYYVDEGKNYSTVAYLIWWAWKPLELSFYFGKEGNIEQALQVVDKMIKDDRIEMVVPLPKKANKNGILTCTFQERQNAQRRFDVAISVGRLPTCKQVGTGQFEEIMEYVCE